MHYHPVIDRFPLPVPLDALSAIVYAAVFVGVAVATFRRPSYGLASLIFIQPFAWHHDVAGTTITLSKAALAGAALGLCAYPQMRALIWETRLRNIAVALTGLCLATGLTYLVAVHRGPVLRETFKIVEYALLLATSYIAYRLDADDARLVRAFSASVVLVCISALLEEAIGAGSATLVNDHVVPRIAGMLEGPNQLAGYLEIAIGVLGACAVFKRPRLLVAALALSACTLVLTLSRGGMISAFVAVAVLLAVYRRSALPALRPLAIGAVTGTCGALAAIFLAHGPSARELGIEPAAYAGGVGNRSELWRAALLFFRTHPLLGIGAGNYELELTRAGVYGVRTHANSWYLQSLAEGGIVLFSAVVTFLATILTTLVRWARSSPWTAGAAAASIALAIHQIADYLVFYTKVGGMWMVIVGVGIAASVSALPRERT